MTGEFGLEKEHRPEAGATPFVGLLLLLLLPLLTSCASRSAGTRPAGSVDSLDVEPAEREAFRQQLKRRMESFRASSIVSIKDSIQFLEGSDVDNKQLYIQIINDVLVQVAGFQGSAQVFSR